MRIAGQDGVPRAGPAILAANHRSLLDIPAVAALTGRKVWFMGKDELFRLGPLSSAFRALGGFPVRRGRPDRRALEMATGLLLQGELLAVYPEGTRTPGARFQAMEDGLAYLALRTGAPVIPVAISGTEAVFPPGKRLPRLVRIRALVGEPVWLDGPLEGVIPRSRIKAGTAVLQQRLRDVAYALEPGFRELEGGTAAGA
jgi:1-acyl-sn-glycerol-3-phosphate acyltransferase